MMDEINSIASEYGLTVVEDASQVHGATYKGRKCGNLAHISTFSFYANKIITTGEGGMVLSNNQDYIDRAKQYRNLCMLTSRRFYHDELGDNLRMTNLQAAVGIAQLERVEEFIERKRDLGQLYARKLASISKEIQLQSEMPWANMVYWMYCIQLSDEIQQNNYDIINQLQNHGIGARPFFVGMHQQPALRGLTTTHGVSLPVTEKASMKGLYLPSSVTLVESDIDYIVYELDNILKNKR
jgi:perosamine synthetase